MGIAVMGLPVVTIFLTFTFGLILATEIVEDFKDFINHAKLNQYLNETHRARSSEIVVKELESINLRENQLNMMEKIAEQTIPYLISSLHPRQGKLKEVDFKRGGNVKKLRNKFVRI